MSKVCWQRDGAWQVGDYAIIHGDTTIDKVYEAMLTIDRLDEVRLIKHWPTGELELVDASLLRPYPFEEIPQP